jgi:hypothetical protein
MHGTVTVKQAVTVAVRPAALRRRQNCHTQMATNTTNLTDFDVSDDDYCLCDSDHDLGCFEHFSAEDS